MKDASDKVTADLFPEKRLGRPVTGKAKTDAQRMREYRLRRKEQGIRVVVQHPAEIEQIHDEQNSLFREIDFLRHERDTALKQVAELQKQLELLSQALK